MPPLTGLGWFSWRDLQRFRLYGVGDPSRRILQKAGKLLGALQGNGHKARRGANTDSLCRFEGVTSAINDRYFA
jgi:hypothetical protein